jgi:hypothetical protein
MASPLQRRLVNRDDGLGRIAAQLMRVKRRLNLLTAQQLAFSTLALLLGAGGILVIAAFLLNPTHFLVLGVLLVIALAAGIPAVVVRCVRRFANFNRAATIADERAELSFRLSTVLTLAQDEGKYPLWPFLVEDTLLRLPDFDPRRIERRRVSRAIYGFAAACLIASMAGLMTYAARRHQEALRKVLKNLTLEVDPSEIAPFDNPSGQSAEIEGAPDALRSLAERLQQANRGNGAGNRSALDQLTHKARNFASSLQNRLTGRDLRDTPEKVKLRLAQALGDKPPPPDSGPEQQGGGSKAAPNSSSSHPDFGANSGAPPHQGIPPDQQANNGADSAPNRPNAPSDLPSGKNLEPRGPQGPGTGDTAMPGQQEGSNEEAAGQSAGQGSDPEHLMGPPDAPSHKDENFEIMIDARLSDRSPIASAQPYLPPKVKTDLNPYQHPDEPLDRGSVPPADRDTIRRVFER